MTDENHSEQFKMAVQDFVPRTATELMYAIPAKYHLTPSETMKLLEALVLLVIDTIIEIGAEQKAMNRFSERVLHQLSFVRELPAKPPEK